MSGPKLVKELKFWLLSIAAGLITLHLNLTIASDNNDLVGASLLFWVAVFSLIWQKRHILTLQSDVFSSFFGILLIAWLLVKSANLSGNLFLHIFPFITVLALGLLASGVKGLKQYWQELIILIPLAIPPSLLSIVFDISSLTAKFAAFVLWLLRFEVSRQGVKVILPTGFIDVYPGCSGINVMLQLLGMAFIFLAISHTNLVQKILLPIVAILLAFAVNGVRVALMAVLVASYNWEAFKYWHLGDGSLIFSAISVLSFGILCHFFLLKDDNERANSLEL